MKKSFKRMVAVLAAATMVFGSTMTTFATEVSTSGSEVSGQSASTYEGNKIDKSAFSVDLPTTAADKYEFIIDPNEVLKDASAAAVEFYKSQNTGATSVTFEGVGTDHLFFKTVSGTAVTYSSVSEKLQVINKSSFDVQVDMKVTPVSASGITFVASKSDLATTSGPAMWIAASASSVSASGINVSKNDAILVSGDAVTDGSLTATVSGMATNFDVTRAAVDKNYQYTEKSGVDDESWQTIDFQLEGECGTNDWDDLDASKMRPGVKVVWKVTDPTADDSTADDSTADDSTAEDSYTEETGFGMWGGTTVWLAKTSSDGFSANTVTLEVSSNGTTYSTVNTFSYDGGWVSVAWDDLAAATSSPAYIRVTDGTTRYTVEVANIN